MSTYVDFFCIDCGEGTDLNANRCHESLAALMKYRDQLSVPGSLFTDTGVWFFTDDFGGGRLMGAIRFFSAHVGHRVVVKSEYGGIFGHSGECNERPPNWPGEKIGNWFEAYCFLPKGHEGDHKPGHYLKWNDELKKYLEVMP